MVATVGQYEEFIVPEHTGQPDYTATIDLSVQPFVDEQNVVNTFTLLFDLDVAVGSQLDAVGVRIGRNRFVSIPISGVYFSWDIAGLGWDQGYWQGQFDPSTGVVALDDTTYRALLRAIIVANMWNGTIAGAAPALADLFNSTDSPGTLPFIVDGLEMDMWIGLAGTPPPLILQGLIKSRAVNLKPVGVMDNYVIPSGTGPIFGLDSQSTFIAGLDTGYWGTPL